jgi:hypothetical protein
MTYRQLGLAKLLILRETDFISHRLLVHWETQVQAPP